MEKVNTLKQFRLYLIDKQPGQYAIESDKPYLITGFVYKIMQLWVKKQGQEQVTSGQAMPILYKQDENRPKYGTLILKENFTSLLNAINKDRTELKTKIANLTAGETLYHDISKFDEQQKKKEINIVKNICYSLRAGEIICTVSEKQIIITPRTEQYNNVRQAAFELFFQMNENCIKEFNSDDPHLIVLYRQYMYAFNELNPTIENIKAKVRKNKITFYRGELLQEDESIIILMEKYLPETKKAILTLNNANKISEIVYLLVEEELEYVKNILKKSVK